MACSLGYGMVVRSWNQTGVVKYVSVIVHRTHVQLALQTVTASRFTSIHSSWLLLYVPVRKEHSIPSVRSVFNIPTW